MVMTMIEISIFFIIQNRNKYNMIKYQGMEFQTCEKVYEPAEDTFLLAENLKVKKTDQST